MKSELSENHSPTKECKRAFILSCRISVSESPLSKKEKVWGDGEKQEGEGKGEENERTERNADGREEKEHSKETGILHPIKIASPTKIIGAMRVC